MSWHLMTLKSSEEKTRIFSDSPLPLQIPLCSNAIPEDLLTPRNQIVQGGGVNEVQLEGETGSPALHSLQVAGYTPINHSLKTTSKSKLQRHWSVKETHPLFWLHINNFWSVSIWLSAALNKNGKAKDLIGMLIKNYFIIAFEKKKNTTTHPYSCSRDIQLM